MKIANRIRADICKMMSYSKSSHIGSALSIVDILKVLYFDLMNIHVITSYSIHYTKLYDCLEKFIFRG